MSNSKNPKNHEPSAQDSFDLRKHEREAVVQSVYGHSVGLVVGETHLGSAVAVRWGDHSLLITANHVVKDASNEELQFAPRPPVSASIFDRPE